MVWSAGKQRPGGGTHIWILHACTFSRGRSAFASFDEQNRGSIAVGKLADFVMLDRDICTIDPVSIREARVVCACVGGRTVFQR